jgi:glycosyltransferase involved in cell wall biosynthesis
MNPLVSVVIPTYNRRDPLKDAVETALTQTYQPIEVIVVDDASDYDVAMFVDSEFESEKVSTITHAENQGPSKARNTGIRNADGKYVAFLDDDDVWEAEKIAAQVECAESNPDVGLVTVGMNHVNSNGEVMDSHIPPFETGNRPLQQLLCRNVVGGYSCILADQSVFDTAGYLDESFPPWEDLEWYVRIAQETDFGVVPKVLVQNRSINDDKISLNYEKIRDSTAPRFLEQYSSLAREFGYGFSRKFKSYIQFKLGRAALLSDRYTDARRHFIQSFRMYPLRTDIAMYAVALSGGQFTYELMRRLRHIVA